MVALPELIFWLLNFPFVLMVYQEPMILQWAKVVTVIHRINLTRTRWAKEGYNTASAQQDQMGGA
jgi:hypothetical protein